MKYNTEWFIAIDESIVKWEDNLKLWRAKTGWNTCGLCLCDAFHSGYESEPPTCVFCPISHYTGFVYCAKTPHKQAQIFLRGGSRDVPFDITKIQKEIDFLKEVRAQMEWSGK